MEGKILIFGASGHARVVAEIVEREGRYTIAGIIDRAMPAGTPFLDYRSVGDLADLPAIIQRHGICGGFVAIGDNWTRHEMVKRIREVVPDFRFVNAIHPSAQLGYHAILGSGTVAMPLAIINSRSRVGSFCIINTKASLSHDCCMKDYSSLGPNATLGGNVEVGEFSAVALGANVVHEVTIGEYTVIGAGATVVESVPAYVVAYGTPARVVRTRRPNDAYL